MIRLLPTAASDQATDEGRYSCANVRLLPLDLSRVDPQNSRLRVLVLEMYLVGSAMLPEKSDLTQAVTLLLDETQLTANGG